MRLLALPLEAIFFFPSLRSNLNRYCAGVQRMASDTAKAPPACVPCSTMDKSHLLPASSLPAVVARRLPLWEVADDSKSISRTFVARNFQAALDAINSMGAIAEEQSHHPDFHLTNYRQLQIVVSTHKIGGLTENDLTLAELLDQVPIEYSPKWLQEHPEAKSTTENPAA